ncbi:MAG: 3-hydroxyacyl-CoA dehydrogenase [Burkholderiales bacterium]|nr:3-hydroxyacyl-CoA dehydrogenase [Burkholderiales bacterium]
METIAIIGTGLIGRAWATVFARAGHPVRLFDAAPGAADKALGLIREGLSELRAAQLVDEAPDTIAARISAATTLQDAVRDAGYVQENTSEREDIKRQVFSDLDAAAPPDCILASSTSTIQTSRFAGHVPGRHRCLVAHPVNPPHIVPIVELSPAPFTAPEVVERTRALHEKVGQVPILVKKEIEGFILNRLQAALLLEAWHLVDEGYVSTEDLDKTIRDGLGLRWAFMGPFETIDLNAPGGISDYADRFGEKLHGMMQGTQYRRWEGDLVARVEAERRKLMPQSEHAEREAWRDRRLMALVAHKRAQDKGHR